MSMTPPPQFPALVRDPYEWEEFGGARTWSIFVPADPARLPGLQAVRDALAPLGLLLHPDHYLHVTIRQLDAPGCVDDATLDAIGASIASVPGWTATVRGVRAFPKAVWADPDTDGRFVTVLQSICGTVGALTARVGAPPPVAHLTLGYPSAPVPADDVTAVLAPLAERELGTIDVREAVLAELAFDRPYPQWRVLRRFPFGPAD